MDPDPHFKKSRFVLDMKVYNNLAPSTAAKQAAILFAVALESDASPLYQYMRQQYVIILVLQVSLQIDDGITQCRTNWQIL
jgi:hypothetical protein